MNIYKIGHNNGYYERSIAARIYKHRVLRTFIDLMDRVLFGVDGLVTNLSILFQNLKYLGLLAMSKILKTHPKSVQGHKDLILRCLDDPDESIRLR